jgi:hypothetical protein
MYLHSLIVIPDILKILALTASNSLGDTRASNRINFFTMGFVSVTLSMIFSFALDETRPEVLLLVGRFIPILLGALLSINRFWWVTDAYQQVQNNNQDNLIYQNNKQQTLFGKVWKETALLLGPAPIPK